MRWLQTVCLVSGGRAFLFGLNHRQDRDDYHILVDCHC